MTGRAASRAWPRASACAAAGSSSGGRIAVERRAGFVEGRASRQRPLEVVDLGRGHRLTDGGPDPARRVEEPSGARPAGGGEQPGDRFQALHQDPAVRVRIDQLERARQVARGDGVVSRVDVEASEIDMPERDRRAGAGLLAGVDRDLGVAACGARMGEPAGHRGQAIRHGPLGWPVAQLAEDEERLVARLHRGLEIARLPVRQIQRGEDMPVREGIAGFHRDRQRALQCRAGRVHDALVGQQRTEVEQGRARLPFDTGPFEPGEGRFQEAAGGGQVVGRGRDRAATAQGPALAERVAEGREQRLGLLDNPGAEGEVRDPVGEMPPAEQRRGAQRRASARATARPPGSAGPASRAPLPGGGRASSRSGRPRSPARGSLPAGSIGAAQSLPRTARTWGISRSSRRSVSLRSAVASWPASWSARARTASA